MDARTDTELARLLNRIRPESVLIVAPEVPATVAEYAVGKSRDTVTHIVYSNLADCFAALRRYDFALVCGTLEHMGRTEARQLVGRLRDMHAKLLWVSVPECGADDKFSRGDAIAQGMRAVHCSESGGAVANLHEFSLQFYKPAPKWLNSDNWANPDQWDKRRW